MTKMSKYIDKCFDIYTIAGKDVKKLGVSEKVQSYKKINFSLKIEIY